MARVLDKGGILLAVFLGAVMFFSGGFNYLLLMLVFFVLAIAVTRYEHEIKRDMGLYEHERGWENVLSNGLLPAILAAASGLVGPAPFMGSVAAITADKFGSELGVLGKGNPVSIFTLQPVKPGTSGAMSPLGTVASLLGSTAVAFAAIPLFHLQPSAALIVALAGFVGCIADTAFGVLEERGIGTKGTTNFICSLVGAIIAFYLVK